MQVGEKDQDYERNIHAAEIDNRLNQLQQTYAGGFVHDTFIHVGGTHNSGWDDDSTTRPQTIIRQTDLQRWIQNTASADKTEVNTNAVDWVSRYTRDPLPEKLVWNTGVYAGKRKSQGFYWLDRDGYLKDTVITASYNKSRNEVRIEQCDAAKGMLKIFLSPDMVDVFRDVKLNILGTEVTVRPIVSSQIMKETMAARGDINYVFTSEIDVSFDSDNGKITVKPVDRTTTDYSVKGIDSLLYWDSDGLFYVDQSLLGCSYEELRSKLNLDLPKPVLCDWLTDGTRYTSYDKLKYPGVCFFFRNGVCFKIYAEQEGTPSAALKSAFRKKFGALFTENGLPSSVYGAEGVIGNGGMSWHGIHNNPYNGKDHTQQYYELF
ncbi:MAG: hypothetical protein Q4B22_00400 [Eubacteriales bacterium]|nr:hypothetical protein [Eubacteriales bacterium]